MEDLRTLIEQYRSAWVRIVHGTGDVDEVNEFFHLPCIFVGADGPISLFSAAEDISTFHRPRLESFRQGGVKKPKAKDLQAISLGTYSALAGVSRTAHYDTCIGALKTISEALTWTFVEATTMRRRFER